VLNIRPATKADRDAIWRIFRKILAAGDTYAFDPQMSRANALACWFQRGAHAYVAELDSLEPSSCPLIPQIAGTYVLKPNQAGGGAHDHCR